MAEAPPAWIRIRRNGQLPPASMIGPNSPYFRFLPNSGVVGPNSPYPRQFALPAAPATPSGQVATQALMQTAVQNAQPALNAGPRVTAMGPASGLANVGVQAATNPAAQAAAAGPSPAATAARVAAGAAPMADDAAAAVGATAGGTAARSGLLGTAMNSLKSGGWKGVTRGGLVGLGLGVGGKMLDESNLLGGSESAANDYTSKALKWAGVGAGVGTLFGPGVGTAVGAGVGGLIGLGHEGLERAGVLRAPTTAEQVNETITNVDTAAREIGLPEQALSEAKRMYNAKLAFLEPDDKANRIVAAQEYENTIKEAALAYATDPAMFMQEMGIGQEGAPSDTERALILQAAMVNAVKPYADNFMANSEATAASLEGMAGTDASLAPMYQRAADQQRMLGSLYATDLIQSAQLTPYQVALENQASYLNQMSNSLVQQAMGQVGQPAQNAGSQDLTALIDAQMNELQPN